jgi:hypothetical protein
MALALGLENKRNVILAVVLLVGLVVAVYVTFFSGPSAPPPAPTGAVAVPVLKSVPTAGGEAQKLSNAGIDPALDFAKLAQSEDVLYTGTGRNIFSAESAPPPIPKAIAPPRPVGPAGPAIALGPPPPPKPPAIDLRYFGYEMDAKNKTYRAFFMHGEDVFIAQSGDIVDHRYKVGAIHPQTVEITDLSYNNTQSIALTSN